MAALEQPVTDGLLDEYAAALRPLAKREVSAVATTDATRATETAVIGTVLLEPVLLTIRRMAQEDASSRKLNLRARQREEG